MYPLIRRGLKNLKLSVLWVTRILLAPNRFNVGFFTRIRFAIFGGFIPDQVALYKLDRRSKREYLSEFDWYRSRWINEPFNSMLNNKVICNQVLESHIMVPEIVFIKNRGHKLAYPDPAPLTSVEPAVDLLQEAGSLFMKPINAGRGKGVYRLDFADGEFFIDSKPTSREKVIALLDREDGWFLSKTVQQHPGLSAIYAQTTNTIRIITMRSGTEPTRIFFAVLRIGTSATIPVDNGSRGGRAAKIDMATGELTEARTLWSHQVFENHPDSGAPIRGAVVPEWDEVKRKVLATADAIPYVQFVAWDILVTPDGPCVIEANTSTGPNIIQIWGAQRNGELGDFYRQHGVIR